MRVLAMQASPPHTSGVLVIPGQLLLKLWANSLMTSAFSVGLKARSCVSSSSRSMGNIAFAIGNMSLSILRTVFDCQPYNKGFKAIRQVRYQRQIEGFRIPTKNCPDY